MTTAQWVSVATALIAAAASIFGAVMSNVFGQRIKRENDERLEQVKNENNERLEQLKTELADWKAEQDAQRDYRYDAIKRLYTDLQPLLFQLSELCDSAFLHTRGLARTGRNGNLGAVPGSWVRLPAGWPDVKDESDDSYYFFSTVYRVLVPVAVVSLMRRRLTFVDLTVDSDLGQQYRFARALAGTWNSGFDVAGKEPPLAYDPHGEPPAGIAREPAVYGLQHLYAGQIDAAVACLVASEADGRVRHRTYGEFDEALRAPETRTRIDPAIRLFADFHPRTHPVLWRMLVVQAHLYRSISATFSARPGEVVAPGTALPEAEWSTFDWREPGSPATEDDAVRGPFRGALAYLDDVLRRPT